MKELSLADGSVAFLDDDDFERLSHLNWRSLRTSNRGTVYVVCKIKGKLVYLHRLLAGTKGTLTDHINGNGLDNRKENLRSVTYHQSAWNTKKKKCGTTSKYKGVGWVKKDGAFQARIRTPNGRISLGYFKDDISAAIAYNKKALELHGEFAKLNDIG